VTTQTKFPFALVILCTVLIVAVPIHAETIRTAEGVSPQAVRVSTFGAGQSSLKLVSLLPLVVEGKTLGTGVIYDDPTTQRPADYFELYDSKGGLFAVGWFDKFGIQRMAVDRALLEQKDDLEGVLVTLIEGDPI
jgi:hypothetical protein